MSPSSEVAIIGMGCRFPGGAVTAEAFWNILENGYDAIVDVPRDRWSIQRFYAGDPSVPGKAYVCRGGFLREPLEDFDAQFFGISPREATPMDPQQRLLLEVAWEACEDAGVVPGRLRGSSTGVFVGGFTLDNQLQQLNANNLESISTYTAVSTTLGMLSNRVSHAFDLRGPSMTIDTACSSSLVALHLACQSLALEECDLALAAGVNVMFRPAYAVAMSKGGFLAPDGRCKAFDARGDGYGRGEGAGVILLKPLRAALRDGDPIRAVIVSTGVNQDGHTQGITLPNEQAQAELFSRVCRRAGVRPEQVQYVEAHGTGTAAGDTAEARAIGRIFGSGRPANAPLLVGSAKTNIGHLEAAAGIAGVIKTSLALAKGCVPPSLHHHQPPAGLDLAELNLRIPVAPTAWPAHDGRALAAVNGFGFGGTNAHALLARAPQHELAAARPVERPLVIPVSARSDQALRGQMKNLFQWLEANPALPLSDLGYTLAQRRSHHAHRAALVARSPAELSEQLRQFFVTRVPSPNHSAERLEGRRPARLAFVYTGMGAQSWGMGMDLLAREPMAQQLLERCDVVWSRLSGWSLRELFAERTGAPMREPRHAQPANFVLQVLLTELCRGYGIVPAAVVGHSTGEIAAAWCAGSLDLEAALRLTWHRSRLQQRCVGRGGMLAVGASLEELASWLPEQDAAIDIAALNGPRSVTLAGPVNSLEQLAERLRTHGIWARTLAVDVPYHSREMTSLKDEFLGSLADLSPRLANLPAYSSVTGAALRGGEQDAGYFFENLRGTVRFGDALAQMARDGFDTFLEIGPHPVLSAAIKDGLGAQQRTGEVVPSLRRGAEETSNFAEHVGRLYTLGVELDWAKLYPTGNLLSLPPYAWDRQRLWSESAISRADRFGGNDHPLLVRRVGEATVSWEGDLSVSAHPYLAEHRFDGEAIFPAAGFIELAVTAARAGRAGTLVLEDLRLERALAIVETPLLRLHPESNGRFSIHARSRTPDSEFQRHVSGRASNAPGPAGGPPIDHEARFGAGARALDVNAFYERAARLGLEYGQSFRSLRSGQISAQLALTRLEVAASGLDPTQGYWVHPALLDGAFQTCLAWYLEQAPELAAARLPVAIRTLRLYRQAGPALWCECRFAEPPTGERTGGARLVDLTLFDDEGAVLEIEGLETRAVPARRASSAHQLEVYTQRWLRQVPHAPEPREASWQLVLCDGGGVGTELCARALPVRMHSVCVTPGPAYRRLDATRFELPRGSRADLERLFAELSDTPFADVVYLWSLDQPDVLGQGNAAHSTGTTDLIDLLHLCQALAASGPHRHAALTIATAGCQQVEAADAMLAAPAQHALWSAARALAIECPERTIRVVDLASQLPFTAASSLLTELCLRSSEPEVAHRGEQRFVGRVVPLGSDRYPTSLSSPDQAYALEPLERDGKRSLAFVEVPRRVPSGSEVEVEVTAHVLLEPAQRALDATAGATVVGSSVCSGRVSALGPEARSVALGERVVLCVPVAAPASHALVPERQVLIVPAHFPEAQAGTLLDWLDACRALFTLGGLEAGGSVMVHRAECGLGHAAVQLAQWAGARVLATAATAEAREALRQSGIEHVSDSESLQFQRDALAWTNGRGVDLVLNTLAGDLRAASFDCLARGGTLVDALPSARHDALPLPHAATALRYFRCDRAAWLADASERALALQELAARYRAEARPLPLRTFPASSLHAALEELQRSKSGAPLLLELQQGPVTLAARLRKPLVRANASYIVSGGFGGVGLASLSWLARQGARFIGVLSRSGPQSVAARETVRALRAAGVQLSHREVDIGNAGALVAALRSLRAELPPVRGVLHGAAVLADADHEQLSDVDVVRVMSAKAGGGLHLHEQLADAELDFFVCHGSISGAFGNARQASYAGANGFLRGLCAWRRSQGLAATCLDWGPIAGTGLLSQASSTEAWLSRLGLLPIAIERVFETLEEALDKDWGAVVAADIDWPRWLAQLPPRLLARFSLVQPESDQSGMSVARSLRGQLLALAPPERSALLLRRTSEVAAQVLAMHQSRIDASSRLQDLGIDSLMAQEMSQALYERTGVRLRTLYMARGPSLAEVADLLVDGILCNEAAA